MAQAPDSPSRGAPLDQQRVAAALRLLDASVVRWRSPTIAAVRRQETRFDLDLGTLRGQLPGGFAPRTSVELAAGIAVTLGLPLPDAIAREFHVVRELLRPRLVTPAELTGPRRSMCRRPSIGTLLRTVSLGTRHDAPLVRTADLDRWGIGFESLFLLAIANLRRVLGADDLHEVDGSDGALVLLHDQEPASSGLFILRDLVDDEALDDGVVFSVPTVGTMLLLPVVPGGGATGLAGLIQATYSMSAAASDPLSTDLFWWTPDGVDLLPVTQVEEEDRRRVHLEATGVMADLLRTLGELE